MTLDDVPALARGCAILGTGGGGDVETGSLTAVRAIDEFGEVPLIPLSEVPDDSLVLPLSGIGAPTVAHEMLMSGEEPLLIRDEVERILGRPVAAVMACEIGGSNGVGPVGWAARLGLPLVDADGMGRAFPEVQMVAMYVAGRPVNIVVLADVQGNVTTVRPVDGLWSERISRAVCVASGASALMADYVLTGAQARGAVIEGTVTAALAIGRAVRDGSDPLGSLCSTLDATVLIGGKVVDVERRTGGGFVRGSLVVDGTGDDRGRLLRVEIQNENLIALEDGRPRACVPDLITVVDAQTAGAISTESLRYGQRVAVLSWPCAPIWRTERGLATAGPRAFGYDIDYTPVEELNHG
ncbi:DUF917 domain-containing protein [Actinomadura luteofluorescens]|uniref:DUF917 domain-containing protein n=1 Tax=Actinomadura luteofluorescens TaxID=46163 RepID=UPI003480BF19